GASHGDQAQGEARDAVRGAIAAARAGRARCRAPAAARQKARNAAAPGSCQRDGRADRPVDHLAGAKTAGVALSAREQARRGADARFFPPALKAALGARSASGPAYPHITAPRAMPAARAASISWTS